MPFHDQSLPVRFRELSLSRLPSSAAVPVSSLQLKRSLGLATDHNVADIALSQKLGEELRYEKEENTGDSTPAFVNAIVEQGVWTVSWTHLT
jgi:hypothetical protein